ncbi:uncharacterized protein LOC132397466 [Hypanus sabinus]|uniref:uncharacterized protein LOC132397466 n=1 Tax=Hypanus sabinus TaxID=79690 RepID=UPI0028C42BD3|nr:uncharacterized protein LOC132397466 [Hypanus sabinus]
MNKFYWRLVLGDYFGESELRKTPFTPPSDWMPKRRYRSEAILEFKSTLGEIIEREREVQGKPNLTRKERAALTELRQSMDIVMKPVDKGSSIVIMDKQQYLFEAHRQLNNTEHYTKLKELIYWETHTEIRNILQELERAGYLKGKLVEYLTGIQPRARKFYILPKIHKNPDSWTAPGEIPPGRPIVSDYSSESYRIAEFIDASLTRLSQKHPSYIKDTYHFVSDMTFQVSAP